MNTIRSVRGPPDQWLGCASSTMRPVATSATRYGPDPRSRGAPSGPAPLLTTRSPGGPGQSAAAHRAELKANWMVRASEARTSRTTPGTPRKSAAHTGRTGADAAVAAELTGEAIRHLRGRERSSIVKADAGAEGKRPGEPVSGNAPAGGKGGLDVRRGEGVGHQGIEHLARNQRDGARDGDPRIEVRRERQPHRPAARGVFARQNRTGMRKK